MEPDRFHPFGYCSSKRRDRKAALKERFHVSQFWSDRARLRNRGFRVSSRSAQARVIRTMLSGLDRIRIDRTHIVGSVNPVNPVYINSVGQIHAVDRIAVGDSNQPRSALGTTPSVLPPLAFEAVSERDEAAGQPPREHQDDPNQEHPHERLPADDPQGGQLV